MSNPVLSVTASASDVQKNFGAYHDRALSTPVRVTKYGRETVYIISAQTFHDLQQAQRGVPGSADRCESGHALVPVADT